MSHVLEPYCIYWTRHYVILLLKTIVVFVFEVDVHDVVLILYFQRPIPWSPKSNQINFTEIASQLASIKSVILMIIFVYFLVFPCFITKWKKDWFLFFFPFIQEIDDPIFAALRETQVMQLWRSVFNFWFSLHALYDCFFRFALWSFCAGD